MSLFVLSCLICNLITLSKALSSLLTSLTVQSPLVYPHFYELISCTTNSLDNNKIWCFGGSDAISHNQVYSI